jgi:hypothetical protein
MRRISSQQDVLESRIQMPDPILENKLAVDRFATREKTFSRILWTLLVLFVVGAGYYIYSQHQASTQRSALSKALQTSITNNGQIARNNQLLQDALRKEDLTSVQITALAAQNSALNNALRSLSSAQTMTQKDDALNTLNKQLSVIAEQEDQQMTQIPSSSPPSTAPRASPPTTTRPTPPTTAPRPRSTTPPPLVSLPSGCKLPKILGMCLIG